MINDKLTELAIWREAQNCSIAAWQAIFSVLRNRLEKNFMGARTMAEVILKKYQFSSFNWNDPNSIKFPRSADVVGWRAWQGICDLVDSNPPDNTNGADSYFDSSIQPPNWATPNKKVGDIAPFHFYKEV